jgi:hypothetical protein
MAGEMQVKEKKHKDQVNKESTPKGRAVIYPQRGFMMPVISGSFWNNGVME